MPMYWDAYLADTTHLSTEEHGAYLLLLAAMWRRNGSVPDDDKDNARILGLTVSKWRKIKARFASTVSGFIVENGSITQEKLQKTWENTQEKIEKNRKNGAKGGRAAARNINDLAQASATNSQERKATIPEPEPEPYKEEPKGSLSLVPIDDQPDECSKAIELFKSAASESGWPIPRILNQSRKSALKARLKECGGIEGWRAAIDKAKASKHCCGQNDRGWVLTFDFITNANSFAKLMEGNYDNRDNNSRPAPNSGGMGRPTATQQIADLAIRRAKASQARGDGDV